MRQTVIAGPGAMRRHHATPLAARGFARALAWAAAALAAWATSAPAAAPEAEERFFNEATAYTVKVKASVPIPFSRDMRGTRFGAGFVVDARRGWVLTNAHVISRSPSRVEAAFRGGDYTPAQKVYVDSYLDLAVIELPRPLAAGVRHAALDCDSLPKVGHPVGAFGHPWRLEYTGSRGVISGITSKYGPEFLQTDAAINQGNSGGPLISLVTGRVVGINTAMIEDKQIKNAGFAVAARYVCRVLDLLREGADPSPPDIGMEFFKDLDNKGELKVARADAASAAFGFAAGQIVLRVEEDDAPVRNLSHLVHALRGRLRQATVVVSQDGAEKRVRAGFPPAEAVFSRRGVFASGALFAKNMLFRERDFHLPEVAVHYVEDGSVADAAELQQSDYVEAIDGRPVTAVEDAHGLLDAAARAGREAILTLRRFELEPHVALVTVERRIRVDRVEWVGGQ